MTRRSRRELERALDDLAAAAADTDDAVPGEDVVIRRAVVGPDGEVVDTDERTLSVGDGGGR
jgi:hypothetical protein